MEKLKIADKVPTILVPTDFSEEADNALLYATEIAATTKAKIVLFHAFHHPIFSPYPYNEDAKKLELEEEKMEQLQAKTSKLLRNQCRDFSVKYNSAGKPLSPLRNGFYTIKLKGQDFEKGTVQITCVCTFGLITEEILKAIRVYEADLVVMGMRGAGAISQALIGSTTMAIIQSSDTPVLAVPAHSKFKGLQSAVAAINPATLPEPQLLSSLGAIVKAFNSKLHVLHLYKEDVQQQELLPKREILDALQNNLQGISYDVQVRQTQDIARGIRKYVQEQQGDLLILLPGEHSFLNRLLSKPTTMQVAAKAYVPLLTLPITTPEPQQQTLEEAAKGR